MPDQLTVTTPPPAAPVDAPPVWRGVVVRLVVQVLGIVAVFAVTGALAGVVWQWIWSPPTGVVVHHQWLQDEAGLRGDFSGTGTYVAVAVVAGFVSALLVGILFDRHEVLTLVVVLGASVLAGVLMHRVGSHFGPADPVDLARSAKDGTKLPGTLTVSGDSPFRAFPGGAVAGLLVVFFGLTRRRRHRPGA